MTPDPQPHSPSAALRQINDAWLAGRVDDFAPFLHPEIVMVYPGWAGRGHGRDIFLAGFRDFCQNAKVHEFREEDHQVDIAGNTAVVTFCYEMVYEHSGSRYRCSGRDLWVFEHHAGQWLAVWRTMLDTVEDPA